MGFIPLCIMGHEGPESDSLDMPYGWRFVPARYDRKEDTWIYDVNGMIEIPVCPNHHLKGEPSSN